MMRRGATDDHLFFKADWFSVAENQKRLMGEEVRSFDGNRLLNTAPDDLARYLIEKYSVDVPVLDDENITADQREEQIDVSRDPSRFIRDPSRPFYIAGTAVEVTIPFTGDGGVFGIRPTSHTMNPPRGVVSGQNLVITIRGANLAAEQVRNQITEALNEIKASLSRLQSDAKVLADQLPQLAHSQIEDRRRKLLADRSLVASLGFPMKQRADTAQTYRAPEVRRRIQVAPPLASTAPYKPEPALDMAEYEHILSVMNNMVLVMERSPSAFDAMGEEALRMHFLMQLNGHYEGQATGETFNYEGKTDLLVRSAGKNIFIAEFKYWGGPKKLSETIDQLLGYLSWRDTKAAIVIFNRQKNFSTVLESIMPTVEAHPNWKRTVGRVSETSFRFVFALRDDPNREMILTIQAFDVPQPGE